MRNRNAGLQNSWQPGMLANWEARKPGRLANLNALKPELLAIWNHNANTFKFM